MRLYWCNLLPPKPSVYLIAIIDVILGSVAVLLSTVALTDVEKVFGIPNHQFQDDLSTFEQLNRISSEARLERFGHLQGQMILLLILSGIFLLISLGLLWGVRKDWAWPIKCWLIYCCTLSLLGIISICVLSIITGELIWLLLVFIVVLRIYEIWIVFDYLRTSRFATLISSRSSSSEILHNV